MDHIIREAAEKHHPSYTDSAWQQMNQLLDKHLPEEEPKKRFPLFWLLLLLLGGGAVFTILEFTKSNKPVTASVSTPAGSKQINNSGNIATNSATAGNTVAADKSNVSSIDKDNGDQTTGSNSNSNAVSGTFTVPVSAGNLSKPIAKIKSSSNGKSRIRTKTGSTGDESGDLVKNTTSATESSIKEVAGIDPVDESIINTLKEKEAGIVTQKDAEKNIADVTKKKDTAATDLKKTAPDGKTVAAASSKKKPDSKGFSQNFSVLLSTGADLSFIKSNKLGKATVLYGAGIGYSIKKFKIRAGFYVSDKIYTAGKDDYYIDPAAPVYFRGELQYIDANCKVFEIPLQVSYNFANRKNHNWFAGAGISSLLMKRETYDYFWKTQGGVTMNKPFTIDNQNKHYFSVLTVSGGYQYNLNNRLFVTAEPYIKLPLTGIGVGKIKLNSGGILLTAGIKPFAKKK